MTTLNSNGVSSVQRVRAGNNLLVTLAFTTLVGTLELLRARAGREDYQVVHAFENDVDLTSVEFPIPQGGLDYDFLIRLTSHESGSVVATMAESVVVGANEQATRVEAVEADVVAAQATADAALPKALNEITGSGAVSASGLYVISAAAEVELPAATAGLWFRFYVVGSSLAITIDAQGADTMDGGYYSPGDNAFHAISAAANHQIGNGDANSGDWLDVFSVDEGAWIVAGFSRAWAA